MNKDQLKIELEKAFAETLEWVDTQPIDNLNKELVPDKWPISHHIYHLVKSTRSANKGLGMPKLALRTMFGKSNRTERTYEALEEKYKAVLIKNNVKAPQNVSAETGRIFDKADLFNKFNTSLKELINALDKWDEQKMSEYVLPHPAIGKCTIREIIYFTIYHTYHHLNILKKEYSSV